MKTFTALARNLLLRINTFQFHKIFEFFLRTALLPRYLVFYRGVQPGHEWVVQAGGAGAAAAGPGPAQCIHYRSSEQQKI